MRGAFDNFRGAVVAAIAVGLMVCAGWLWWICWHDSSVPFLPAFFRREFTLAARPSRAIISSRLFKEGFASINGLAVPELESREKDWKSSRTANVSGWFRPGTNEISVTVSNSLGPPALWLCLKTEQNEIL